MTLATSLIPIADAEVLISSELGKRLHSLGVAPAAARQQLARAARQGTIWRSNALQLPGRERFFASPDFVGSERFQMLILDRLRDRRPGLSRCGEAVRVDNVLLRSDAERLLGDREPEAYTKAAKALEELRLAFRSDANTALDCLVAYKTQDAGARAMDREVKRKVGIQVSRILVDHFRRLSLLSWRGNSVANGREGLARFSGYPFSATGWCWLPAVKRWKSGKPSPCPVLLDVWVDEARSRHIASFKDRLSRITRGRPSDSLGIFAANGFSSPALSEARKAGVMIVDLRQLLGGDFLNLLAGVASILAHVSQPSATDDGQIERVALELENLVGHPFLDDLRSYGLESVTAVIVASEGYEDLRVGTVVPFEKSTREVDVAGSRSGGREVVIVECKAHARGKDLDPADIRKFFTETVPAFLNHRAGTFESCRAEIWSTGIVSEPARAALSQIEFRRSVKPALIDQMGVLTRIPPTLKRLEKLVRTIAASSAASGSTSLDTAI